MLSERVRGSPAGDAGGETVMAQDLARGLIYLRASNMQVMRLQLAQEQQDRRAVMAAMDELVGLDRALGRFIDSIPDPGLAEIGRELDAQKSALVAERLVLARGKIGPALAPPPEPEPITALVDFADHEEERAPQRWLWALAALLVAAAGLALWLAFGGLDLIQSLIPTERPT